MLYWQVFSASFHVLAGLSFTLVAPDAVKALDDARVAAGYGRSGRISSVPGSRRASKPQPPGGRGGRTRERHPCGRSAQATTTTRQGCRGRSRGDTGRQAANEIPAKGGRRHRRPRGR